MDGIEMLKMMQQAFELSKAFGGGADSDNGFDRIAGMLRVFGDGQQNRQRQPSGEDSRKQAIESIKTAIPYIDHRYQRYISVLIKLIEIQSMIEIYGRSAKSMFEGAGVEWRRDMLESLKPYIERDKAVMVDFLIAAIDLDEALRGMSLCGLTPRTDVI